MTHVAEGSGILISHQGNARVLTLARPEALNAINPQMVEAINLALEDAALDASCTALVITGQGRSFCAGADLKAAKQRAEIGRGGERNDAQDFVRSVSNLMNKIEEFPCPVIAGVQGLALAGGMELVLCCDLVIAAESSKFGDAHANFGLLPGGGGSIRLPRKIGAARAKQLMFTGEMLPASTLCEWGLVNEVVADADLSEAIASLISKLSTKSPIGLRQMKRLVNQGLQMKVKDGLELEQQVFAEYAQTYDRHEGLAAFAERRKPHFRGC
jgi:enoyl-CoA hydratase/carnithine racemase